MGYYTDFEIEVSHLKSEAEANYFASMLESMSAYPFDKTIGEVFDEGWELTLTKNYCKFYEYGEVFKKLSKDFPHVTIDVYGEGEEGGDIWKHRFKDGKDERVEAVITFPEFTLK